MMGQAFLIFCGVAVLFALYTWATIWSRRETRVRGLAVLGFIVILGALGPASLETLGWHRPHWAAVRLDGDVVVLSFKLVRGEAIYLYIDAGPGQPRAISLPWSDKQAEKMQEKRKESERKGRKGKFRMRFIFDLWSPKSPEFVNPPPERARPPKPPQAAPSTYFRGGP
jgi:hypothetical protein